MAPGPPALVAEVPVLVDVEPVLHVGGRALADADCPGDAAGECAHSRLS